MVGSSANVTGHAHSPSKSVEKPRALHKAKSQMNCVIEPMDTSPRICTNTEAFTKSVSALNVNEKYVCILYFGENIYFLKRII